MRFDSILKYVTAAIWLAALLAMEACNPVVFIEPLEVARKAFDVPFTGAAVAINVSHGDWEVQNVTVDHIDANWVSEESMRYESEFMSFEILRPQPSKLLVKVDESVNSDASLIQVFIGNDYESEVVSVNVGACCGYSFDRVEYGEPVETSEGFEQVWSKSIANSSGQSMTWECPVFNENFCRTVWFPAATVVSDDMPYVMWYETLMKYVGEPFNVPVPSSFLLDGALSFADEDVVFSYDKMVLPVKYVQTYATASLAPGNNIVKMYWGYAEYEVPYTMWFKHSGEGRDLRFSGTFTSKAYNGKWRVEL